MKRLSVLAGAILLGLWAQASAAPAPTISNAADGIFNAFHSHPLVGLGDMEGNAQEEDFFGTLVRDPRFAAEIGNLVLETGSASQQATVDRFVNGETVPYAELRKVWADEAAADPTQLFLSMINIFSRVRFANQSLAPDKRIKVWLSDPPIDWSMIHTKAELDPIIAQRETFPAALITKEILDKGKKALVIYGTNHLSDFSTLKNSTAFKADNLRALVEKTHPGAFYIVMPYAGLNSSACAAKIESDAAGWHAPALIAPLRGTALEGDLLPPGCGAYPKLPGMSDEEYNTAMRNYAGLAGDALLYVGPRKEQRWSPWAPDIYLDANFRAELDRRHIIRTGKPLGDDWRAGQNPATPPPYFSD